VVLHRWYASGVRIGVFGAGAIGCYLGGKLLAAGADVVLVGRLGKSLGEDRLTVSDLGGGVSVIPRERLVYRADAAALADRDVVLVTVKATAVADAGRELAGILPPAATVVSLQNGVSSPEILRRALAPRAIVAGMVPFNVVRTGPAAFHQATSGPLALERHAPAGLVAALRAARMPLDLHDDLTRVQWSKLLVNLNNSVNAIAGLPLREQLAQRDYRRVLALAFAEGLRVLRAAGIRPVRVGRMIPALTPLVLGLPDRVFFRVAATMVQIDPEARSSMQDDLDRRRPTEIDFLNGEIIRLGERHGVPTPVNARIRGIVRAAEAAGQGSPRLPARELLRAVRDGELQP
jgi:2-dehydropantoate 2-reductase